MRLRFIVPALLIGAGLLLPVLPQAQAKTSYKYHKVKKYKASRKFKNKKFKSNKRFKARKATRPKTVRHA